MKAFAITSKGQVTIPAGIREELDLKAGDKIFYEKTRDGILLKPARKSMINDYGFLKGNLQPREDLESIRKVIRKKMASRGLQK